MKGIMKSMIFTRAAALLIAVLISIPIFIACSSEQTAGVVAGNDNVTTEEPTSKYLDNLPDTLTFQDEDVNILWCFTDNYAEEMDGNMVNDALYARDLEIETGYERLSHKSARAGLS